MKGSLVQYNRKYSSNSFIVSRFKVQFFNRHYFTTPNGWIVHPNFLPSSLYPTLTHFMIVPRLHVIASHFMRAHFTNVYVLMRLFLFSAPLALDYQTCIWPPVSPLCTR